MVRKPSRCISLGLFGIHGRFWVLCICHRYFMACYHLVLHKIHIDLEILFQIEELYVRVKFPKSKFIKQK